MRRREPTLKKFPVTSPVIASGRKIRITPIMKTNIAGGSKTNAIPKPKKYKRKKMGEEMLPVANIRRRISVFSIKIPQGPSPPRVNAPWPFFLAAKIIYKSTKTPRAWTVKPERTVCCHKKTSTKERIKTNAWIRSFIHFYRSQFANKRQDLVY